MACQSSTSRDGLGFINRQNVDMLASKDLSHLRMPQIQVLARVCHVNVVQYNYKESTALTGCYR